MNVIARNLETLKDVRRTTQSAIAAVAGASTASASHWFNGDRVPRMKYLESIANYYCISIDDLISESNGLYAKTKGSLPPRQVGYISAPGVRIPLCGTTYANDPSDAVLFDGEVVLAEHLANRHPRCYALEVSGDCMNKFFTSEDYIFVDPDMQPHDDSIAVMLLDGKSETRRLKMGSDTIILVSESYDFFPDIVLARSEFQEVTCQGVVFWWQAKKELQ